MLLVTYFAFCSSSYTQKITLFPILYFLAMFFENHCTKAFLQGDCDEKHDRQNVLSNNNMFRISAPRNIFLVANDFSNFSVLFCLVILLNVGHKTKIGHIYLHIHLLMAITTTILSISRPPLNYA